MTSLTIDAQILACPEPGRYGTLDDLRLALEQYFSTLLEWEFLRRVSWATVSISADASTALIECGQYPFWEPIAKALGATGLSDVYQSKDVVTLAESLLSKSLVLEDALGIGDLLVTDVTVTPDDHLNGRPDRLKAHHDRILGLWGCENALTGEQPFRVLLTTGLSQPTWRFSAEGTVAIVDSAAEVDHLSPLIPLRFRVTADVCKDPSRLNDLLDPIRMWRDARDETCYIKAIEVETCRREGWDRAEYAKSPRTHLTMGAHFLRSAQRLGFQHDPPRVAALLSTLADTACGKNMRQVHVLRTGKGANDPQRTRGDHFAWRRDVGHEFHLHYWQTPTGIELAAVVVHNDFDIPG